MFTFHAINSFAETHRYLGYAILFLGMIIEGELFLLAYGMLLHLKAFDPGDVFIFAYLGVIFSDILWYHPGVFLKKKLVSTSGFLKRSEERARKLFPYFETNPTRALLTSRFVAGTNHATMVLAGFLKMDFKYFLKLQLAISFVWCVFFLLMGYLFSFAALGYSHKFEKFIQVALVLLVAAKLFAQLLKYVFEEKGQEGKAWRREFESRLDSGLAKTRPEHHRRQGHRSFDGCGVDQRQCLQIMEAKQAKKGALVKAGFRLEEAVSLPADGTPTIGTAG